VIRSDRRSDSFRQNFLPSDQRSEHSDRQDLLTTDNKLTSDHSLQIWRRIFNIPAVSCPKMPQLGPCLLEICTGQVVRRPGPARPVTGRPGLENFFWKSDKIHTWGTYNLTERWKEELIWIHSIWALITINHSDWWVCCL